jgi:hypothetical protein
MTMQYSVTVRNNRLDQDETTIGTAPVLRMLSGAPPANCAAAETGTILCTVTLPSDWAAAAAAGAKAKSGTWQDLTADNTGAFGYFRMYDSGIATCHMQGTAGTAGTDMIVDSASVTAGQSFTVTTFTRTAGNP